MFKILSAIYKFYAEYVEDFPSACTPGCSTCCTSNVLATSLEVKYLLKGAQERRIKLPWDKIEQTALGIVYRPSLTTNQVANLCLAQQPVPEDKGVHGPAPCPLLSVNGLCILYEYRPFACRAMTASTKCTPKGEADMDPFLVTINLAMYQLIEHLDEEGLYGNMLDLLLYLHKKDKDEAALTPQGLLPTQRLPGLPVPPWDRQKFEDFLRKLSRQKVDGEKLGNLLKL